MCILLSGKNRNLGYKDQCSAGKICEKIRRKNGTLSILIIEGKREIAGTKKRKRKFSIDIIYIQFFILISLYIRPVTERVILNLIYFIMFNNF